MDYDITHYFNNRHTAKAYNPEKKISDADMEKVKKVLRLSASSVNGQPWHFVIASSDDVKQKIAKATEKYPFNTPLIMNASHVVVFCSRISIDEAYLLHLLSKEEDDGRFIGNDDFKIRMHEARRFFVNMHKDDFKDIDHWVDKQVYLNLGGFLISMATLGIDCTPMEGVDTSVLDTELDLKEKGYRSLFVVPIGYKEDADDYNAGLPKSRLSYDDILTEI